MKLFFEQCPFFELPSQVSTEDYDCMYYNFILLSSLLFSPVAFSPVINSWSTALEYENLQVPAVKKGCVLKYLKMALYGGSR